MTTQLTPIFPGRHGKASNLIAGWRLPLIFQNPQFVMTLADALQRCKAAVMLERGRWQGVVIRRKEGRYYIATSPPSEDVFRGLEQAKSAFAGALVPIRDASALVVVAPEWYRNNAFSASSYGEALSRLSTLRRVPVVAGSARANTWIFPPQGNRFEYQWKRLVK